MRTGYKTSKAPYEDIHFGDMVERYPGATYERIVWRPFRVMMKPLLPRFMVKNGEAKPYPMLKVDKIIHKKIKR